MMGEAVTSVDGPCVRSTGPQPHTGRHHTRCGEPQPQPAVAELASNRRGVLSGIILKTASAGSGSAAVTLLAIHAAGVRRTDRTSVARGETAAVRVPIESNNPIEGANEGRRCRLWAPGRRFSVVRTSPGDIIRVLWRRGYPLGRASDGLAGSTSVSPWAEYGGAISESLISWQ